MTAVACTQPGCGGTIQDGYCDVCGLAPAPPPAANPAAGWGPAQNAGSIRYAGGAGQVGGTGAGGSGPGGAGSSASGPSGPGSGPFGSSFSELTAPSFLSRPIASVLPAVPVASAFAANRIPATAGNSC